MHIKIMCRCVSMCWYIINFYLVKVTLEETGLISFQKTVYF